MISGLLITAACICWGIDNHLTALTDGASPQTVTFLPSKLPGFVSILVTLANFLLIEPKTNPPYRLQVITFQVFCRRNLSGGFFLSEPEELRKIIIQKSLDFSTGLLFLRRHESEGQWSHWLHRFSDLKNQSSRHHSTRFEHDRLPP